MINTYRRHLGVFRILIYSVGNPDGCLDTPHTLLNIFFSMKMEEDALTGGVNRQTVSTNVV